MGQMHPLEVEDRSIFTRTSFEFRLRASTLGQQACVESDVEKIRSLLQLAVHWIQIAENEELVARERGFASMDF